MRRFFTLKKCAGIAYKPPKHLGGPGRQRGKKANNTQAVSLVDDLRQQLTQLEDQNKALRFSQAAAEGASDRFVALFSTVPLALMVIDDSGLVLENNARALALLRPLETDPPLNFLFPLIQAEHVDRVVQGLVTAATQGSCEISELVFSAGSNGVFTGDLHIASIDHAPDDLPSFICAIVDQSPLLTQRRALQVSAQVLKERNEELLQSRTRLAAIINSSLDAIICVDKDHRIIVFNPTAASLFQCPTEQALGRALTDFLPDAARALSYVDIANHAQLGEMEGLTSQGNRVPLDVSMSFEQHPGGELFTLFAHNLTARKKMETHRLALESQLRESQKMQAIGTMAGGIAHDFNNIIGAILGNVELAQQDAQANSAVCVSLTEIGKAGRRARDLVRQILTFSRNDPPHRAALQLADVIHETIRLLKVTLPPNVNFQVNIDPMTPPVMADATQIEQALINLCTNAIHAIGQRPGCIRIELGYNMGSAEDTNERRSGLRGSHVKLLVSDNGHGMSSETLERIFEPFFTTKPVGQGTGLGLSVVHGIMRAHLGSVQVHSTPEKGSEFTLYFPVANTPVVVKETIAPTPSKVTGHGQRVMYVDDDEALVFLVKRVLTRKGFSVIAFTNPREALEALRANPLEVDLLVTDFNMPGYSGIELLRDAQSIRPDLPIALASGYVTPEIESEALLAGARALIHKPNDVDELCQTVLDLLTHKNDRN